MDSENVQTLNPAQRALGVADGSTSAIAERLSEKRSGNTEDNTPVPDEDQDMADMESAEDVQMEEEQAGETEEAEPENIIQTLEELEEELEVPDDYLMSLKAKVKVNGEEIDVPIGDALASYQIRTAQDKRWQDIAAKDRALQEREAQAQQATAQQLQYIQTLAQQLEQQIAGDLEALNGLRDSDPDQYDRMRRQVEDRQYQLNRFKQEYGGFVEQAQQQELARQQQELQNFINAEHAKIPELIPEWIDEDRAKREHDEVLDYAKTLMDRHGYPVQGQLSALDLAVLRKAMLYDRVQQKAPTIKHKIKKLPKRGIARRGVNMPVDKQVTEKAQTRGKVDDIAELMRSKRAAKMRGNRHGRTG